MWQQLLHLRQAAGARVGEENTEGVKDRKRKHINMKLTHHYTTSTSTSRSRLMEVGHAVSRSSGLLGDVPLLSVFLCFLTVF
ncbi:hypothetical protein EYF80_065892 [Liparis tanakae]|uniref:Uncharacterized protein n=1 Tax=Liparis tanakae TaxID=230148 RepID=A0A4Z2E5E0_9TELE|nr:hypothetical protein EYF80_065892 [Liparis tanakae]